jgi:hypothetical protein
MKTRTIFFVGWLTVSGLGRYYGEIFAAVGSDMTQMVSGGGVTVKATYVNPKSTDESHFEVVLDTHSVNLNAYDLKSIAVLRDDTGKTYLATGVESKGSGHHREATLSFPKVAPESERLELVIRDVGGVRERSFRWDVH